MTHGELVLMTNQTKETCQHLECFLTKDKPVEDYVSYNNLTADQLEKVFAIIKPFRDEIEEKEQKKVEKAQARLKKAEAILEKKAEKKKGPKVRSRAREVRIDSMRTARCCRANPTLSTFYPPAGVQEGGSPRRLRHRHRGGRGEDGSNRKEEADDA